MSYRLLVIIAVGVGSFLSTIALAALKKAGFDFNLDGLVGALGTIVGALGLAFGAYFVFIAVDAYGHMKELQNAEISAKLAMEQTQAALQEVNSKSRLIHKVSYDIDNIYQFSYKSSDLYLSNLYQTVISLPSKDFSKEERARLSAIAQSITLSRARLALANRYIREDEVMKHMMTIAAEGAQEDIATFERIISEGALSDTLIERAKDLLISLKRKIYTH